MKSKAGLVDFFIVGQPKSGTTAMHHFLSAHPGIFLSKPKEPSYFCTDLHRECDRLHVNNGFYPIRTLGDYQKLFGSALPEQLVGEASTSYLVSRDAARNIYRYNPNAKIIVFLREPVAFLYSLHRQFLNILYESENDFLTAYRLSRDRMRGIGLPKGAGTAVEVSYRERARYVSQIKRFYDFFPEENVLVIIFDDYVKDNREIYLKVIKFIGGDESFLGEFKKIHERKVPRFRAINRLVRDARIKQVFQKVLTPQQYFVLQSKVQSVLLKKDKTNAKLDKKVIEIIRKDLAEEVCMLSRYLGRDLIYEWGYEGYIDG